MSRDVEADLVIALRVMAGVPSNASNFDMTYDGRRFNVSYSSGSSSSLTLSAQYNVVAKADIEASGRQESLYRQSAKGGFITAIRPMLIKLRDESASDRAAKNEGVNREHQTGDAGFDDDVYIDSPTVDDQVLQTILSERTRNGARELLKLGFDSITIDDAGGNVVTQISAFLRLRDIEHAEARVVNAFANLLSGLPPVKSSGEHHAQRSSTPTVLAVLGTILLFGSPFLLMFIADANNCMESDGDSSSFKDGCGGTALVAIVLAVIVGGLAAFATSNFATPYMKGRSDSRGRILTLSYGVFAFTAVFTLGVAEYIGYAILR